MKTKNNPSQPNQDEAKNQNVNKSLESSSAENRNLKKNDNNENKSSGNEDKPMIDYDEAGSKKS